ncbi:MAG TPA: RNA polymerase sigma factor, partial [Thermoanaerobaculia bacterium]|nr:RNA polymerase sigma factor [Thermoanaerobaculia bacterium]
LSTRPLRGVASPAAPAPAAVPGPSDEELVARAGAGETGAFAELMRRHNQRLFRLARAVVRDDREAEDVVQEAYVRAFTHLDRFEGRARFATWLSRIALHEALARVRRGRRFAALGEEETVSDLPASLPRGPEERAANRELAAALAAAVDALPESHRAVFVLREVEGLSTAETAEVLGLSEPNVKVRLHRARAALRADLERRLGGEVPRLWSFAGERCDRVVTGVMEKLGVGPGAAE